MAVSSLTAMAQDKVEMDALGIHPGETKELLISLTNSNPYTAFQMDIALPAGLSFASQQDENLVTLAAERNQSHVVDFNEYRSNVMRIISYSNNKTAYNGNAGVLLKIRVTADADMSIGNYEVKLSKISFTDLSAGDIAFDDVTGMVNVYGVYAISALSSDETKGVVTLQNGGQAVTQGTTVTATASPKSGYEFYNWTAGGEEKSKDNPYTFTASEDLSLVAHFVAKHYTLTYVVDSAIVSQTSVEYGAQITPLKTPTKEGYIFSGWSDIPTTMPAHDVVITGTFTFDYNTDAYKRLSVLIAQAQEMLDAAKEIIGTECKDVVLDFTGTIETIQGYINAAKAEVEKKYINGELTAESTIDTSAIIAAIEKLKTDAAEAQKKFEETVGIGVAFDDGAKVRAVYDTNGKKVNEPVLGKIHIVVYDNGVTKKIIVR